MDDGRTGRKDHRQRMDVEDIAGRGDDVEPAAQAGVGERGMDRADGEDRRDRQPVEGERPVRQEDDIGPSAGRCDRRRGHVVEGGREPRRPVRRIPRRIEAEETVRVAPVERGFEAVEIGDDRSLQPQRPRSGRPAAEQRGAPAEVDPEVHDDPLALGIDRRVGDLGERLAEMVDHSSVERAPAGRRRVVAHAPQRLVALERHRPDVEPEPLGVEPDEVAQRG